MLKKFLAAAALVAASAVSAAAAIAPVAIETYPGAFPRGINPDRANPAAMLAEDGKFYSLGFGGSVLFDFGSVFKGSTITILETTFVCNDGPFTCSNHVETAEVLVASSYIAGSGDFSGFTLLRTVGNFEAQGGISLFAGDIRFVAVVDTSNAAGRSFDGFDIDAISLTPIPLPSAAWMLLGAMAGVGFLSHRARREA